MLKAVYHYLANEVRPRWKSIVFSWETVISVAVGVWVFRCGGNIFRSFPRVINIATGLIAYAAIALGFCIAGLTISLTFPDSQFTQLLASPHKNGKGNHYSDLIFVFSWTAFVHWLALVALFGVVLLIDELYAPAEREHTRSHNSSDVNCVFVHILSLPLFDRCHYCLPSRQSIRDGVNKKGYASKSRTSQM